MAQLSIADKTANLGRTITIGTAWMVAVRLWMRLIGLVSTVILARLLATEDFGLVAMAMLLVGFLEATSEMSFDSALIQNQNATRDHYDTVWTLAILRGLVIAICVWLLAVPAAEFFDEPRLTDLLSWLALMALVRGFTNVGIVDFRRDLEFEKEFWFLFRVRIISFVVVITAAVILRDYWALIIGMLAAQIAHMLLSYVMCPYRPRLTLKHWIEILHFSKWLFANSMLQYFQNRADATVVGKLIGASSLGIYSVAYEIATLATTEMIAPIRRALLPGYAKLQDNPKRFKSGFIEGYALIFLIGAPAALGLGLTAHLFVPLLLGPNWLAAIPLVQVLALTGFFQVGTANTSVVIIASGRPHLLLLSVMLSVVIGFPTMIWAGMTFGAIGVAWTTVAMTSVLTATLTVFGCRVCKTGVAELLRPMWRASFALVAMVAVVSAVNATFIPTLAPLTLFGQMILAAGLGAATYGAALYGLWQVSGRPLGAEARLFALAISMLRRALGTRLLRRSPAA